LNMPVEIVGCPIVREKDGLAMSSRNAYLSAEERKSALVLNDTLQAIKKRFDEGEKNSEKLISAGMDIFRREPSVRLDYLDIVDPETLDPLPYINRDALAAVAAYVGTTRLIDNITLTV